MNGFLTVSYSLGILLIAITFMIIIVLGMLVLIFNFKIWIQKQQEENEKRYMELYKQVNDTQDLFVKQVTVILDKFKNLLH